MPDNPHTQPLCPQLMDAGFDIANPTEEHRMLRDMVRNFVLEEVEPQALEHDRLERFNSDLFRKLGALGLHGITIDEAYGGVGMDATAVAIVNEELSYSCLLYTSDAADE